MQHFFEKNLQPFAERFEKLCQLLGKNRGETASLLGVTLQTINGGILNGTTPKEREIAVDLLIEQIENNFQPPTIEEQIRKIAREEIKHHAADGELEELFAQWLDERLTEIENRQAATGEQKPAPVPPVDPVHYRLNETGGNKSRDEK